MTSPATSVSDLDIGTLTQDMVSRGYTKSSWPGGFLGQAVVTNTGSSTLNSWKLGWTFPGNQAIDDLWNGDSSQSGDDVTVTNASYNGELTSGASTTVGFIATYSGSNTVPSSLSCT